MTGSKQTIKIYNQYKFNKIEVIRIIHTHTVTYTLDTYKE